MAGKLCKRDRDDGSCGVLSLPEDIIFEVLARLPAKALCRFRCVSKWWRALISDPAFVAAQRAHAGPLMVGVFGSASTDCHELRPPDKDGDVLKVFGSASTDRHELRLLDKDGDIVKVLELTGASWLLPTRLDFILVQRCGATPTIIDPSSGRSLTVVGTSNPTPTTLNNYSFGRASPSNDCKVLHIVLASWNWFDDGHRNWCEVATIMDGGAEELKWRQRPCAPFNTSFEQKATVNGVLYFMLGNTYSESHGRKCIAAFDLESEEWKPEKIKGPLLRRKNEDDKCCITLTELKGTLCMVHNVQYLADLVGHYANIWLLKDPNQSIWVKEYRIQMHERLLLFTKPLDVLGDGTILLLLNKFREAGKIESYNKYILQFYNLRTKTFTEFMEMAEGFNGMAFYTGSLLS